MPAKSKPPGICLEALFMRKGIIRSVLLIEPHWIEWTTGTRDLSLCPRSPPGFCCDCFGQ